MPLNHAITTLVFGHYGPSLIILCLVTAIEIALPRGRISLIGRLSGVLFWTVLLFVTVAANTGLSAVWRAIGIQPLIVLPLRLQWAGPVAAFVAPILGAVIYDFFFYWFHRAQHRWLWRYHQVHHAIRELSAANSYHHISEPFFQWIGMLVPASLLFADTGIAAPVVAILLHFQGSFIHSPMQLNLGPLRIFFCDNVFHRIHHSLEPQHFDRNFGGFTTLWDQLFGTAYFPMPGEWPATGLAGVDPPETVEQWIMLPFRTPLTASDNGHGQPRSMPTTKPTNATI